MKTVLARLLCTSGWTPADVEEVVLIGGTCLIPLVRAGIAEFFQRERLVSNEFANGAVAYGATQQIAGYLAVSTQLPSLKMSKPSIAR